MLLQRHGPDVLRVKGLLRVRDAPGPVVLNAVGHVVHPPEHLDDGRTTTTPRGSC